MSLKSSLALGAATCALLAANTASAGTYISIFGGWSNPDTELNVAGASVSSTVKTTVHKPTFTATGYGTFSFFTPTYTQQAFFASYYGGYLGKAYYNTRQTISYMQSLAGFRDDADSGFVVGGAFGFDFGDGWRAELEAAYRSYDIGRTHRLSGMRYRHTASHLTLNLLGFGTGTGGPTTSTGSGPGGTTATTATYTINNPFVLYGYRSNNTGPSTISGTATTDGDITAFSLMANVWYDYQLGDGPVSLILGGGLGAAKLDFDYSARISVSSITTSTRGTADDWVFAWQAGAGLGFDLGNGMMLSAQYRYFSTGDVDLGGGQEASVNAHEALVGLNIPLGN